MPAKLFGLTSLPEAGEGSALEILDETTSLSTAVTAISFAGDGVTALPIAPGEVSVTIPGGGSGSSSILRHLSTLNIDVPITLEAQEYVIQLSGTLRSSIPSGNTVTDLGGTFSIRSLSNVNLFSRTVFTRKGVDPGADGTIEADKFVFKFSVTTPGDYLFLFVPQDGVSSVSWGTSANNANLFVEINPSSQDANTGS
jgi:hypothetical protein